MRCFFVPVGLRGVLALWFYVGLACAGWALSPPPGGFKEPTYEEMWAGADVVVYGRVVRLERKEVAEQRTRYQVGFEVERSFKGTASGELLLMEEIPRGDGFGFLFQFDRTYVLFAQKTEAPNKPVRVSAVEIVLPMARHGLDAIFGAHGPPDLELAEFLESKTGDHAEAARLKRMRDEMERTRLAKEREARASYEEAKVQLERALKEKGVAERKILLAALDKKLAGNYASEFKELKDVVAKELSLAETYSDNGLKRFQ